MRGAQSLCVEGVLPLYKFGTRVVNSSTNLYQVIGSRTEVNNCLIYFTILCFTTDDITSLSYIPNIGKEHAARDKAELNELLRVAYSVSCTQSIVDILNIINSNITSYTIP